jgi:hypothetical protein
VCMHTHTKLNIIMRLYIFITTMKIEKYYE